VGVAPPLPGTLGLTRAPTLGWRKWAANAGHFRETRVDSGASRGAETGDTVPRACSPLHAIHAAPGKDSNRVHAIPGREPNRL
jgi:hypothetical protein